jgi:hypothetical protein
VDSAAKPALTSRTGVALFAALVLVGLLALVIGGGLAAFRLASRSSVLARTDAVLTAAADYAINSVASSARQLGLDTLSLGVPATLTPSVPGSTGAAPVVVATRLVNDVEWLVADVADTGVAGGHRRINLVARWRLPAMPPSPLVARGNVRLAGTTFDIDTTGDADCRATLVPPITLAPGASVASTPNVSASYNARAADSVMYLLAATQTSEFTNVVRRIVGDTTIAGGSFEGILIVRGALTIAGPFSASGLIVSTGPIIAPGTGIVVTGAMMSFALPGAQPAIDLGPAALHYSRCAVARALRMAIPLRPVRERSWAELF